MLKFSVKNADHIPASIPVFYLQGGFEPDKLHGIYKLMMKAAGKGHSDKQSRTPEEDAMLRLLLNGGDLVSADNLTQLSAWYGEQQITERGNKTC